MIRGTSGDSNPPSPSISDTHAPMDTVTGSLYDFPKYYDLIFGSDWRAEFHFLTAAFEKHSKRKVKRLFEPACGTGRLLVKFAQAGYEVAGNDLNEKAVAFCNKRLVRNGFKPTAVVGDMTDFTVKKKFDAAFNTINSFRHINTEKKAAAHLQCMADALNPGGLYLLGLHLFPTKGTRQEAESWSARKGNLCVNSHMWCIEVDRNKRNEHLGMRLDIYTPTKQFRLNDTMDYRTYTAAQFNSLLKKVPDFELVETYDFSYEIDEPIEVSSIAEDVVFVLRKKK